MEEDRRSGELGRRDSDYVSHHEFQVILKKIEDIDKKVTELYSVWSQAQGGAKALRWFIAVMIPLLAMITWAKSHIKW